MGLLPIEPLQGLAAHTAINSQLAGFTSFAGPLLGNLVGGSKVIVVG